MTRISELTQQKNSIGSTDVLLIEDGADNYITKKVPGSAIAAAAPVQAVAGKTGNISLLPSDVGLGSVPNSDTTNASNITSGTLAAGRLPSVNIGTTSVDLTRASASLSLTGVSIDGNAGTVTNGIYTNGSYSDPSWLTISKSKVGLANVENTALSTWAGSSNITTLGTISTGTVPIANVSGGAPAANPTFTGVVTVPTGTAAVPSLTITGDTNTGIYSPGADTLAASTGGSERLRIDSSGRLLVGTSSARTINASFAANGTQLQVEGTTYQSSSLSLINNQNASDGSYFVFGKSRGTTLGSSTITSSGDLLGSFWFCGADGTDLKRGATIDAFVDGTPGTNSMPGRLVFSTTASGASNPTERLRIDSSGRLLVGTSSARSSGAAIQIESLGNDKPVLEVISNYTNTNSVGAAFLLLTRAGATSLGSVTSVSADNELGSIRIKGYDGTNPITAAEIKGVVDGTPGTNNMPGRLVFSTTAAGASTPTERMRITSGGAAYFFSTAGDTIACASTRAAGTSNYIFSGGHSSTGPFNFGTNSISIYTNGNVQNTNNSYGAISDQKLKENIVDAASQWNDIKFLRIRKYNFKEETGQPTHTQIGLIAQEVELVSPGLVTESPDRDSDGNDLGTTTKSVNYSVLYMKAVKALQEAIHRIESLEATVATLTP